MPYRMGRGDYYRGDYYRGGLFSGLASLAKGAFRVVKGAISGAPLGPVGIFGGALGGAVGHAVAESTPSPTAPIGSSSIATPNVTPPEELVRLHQLTQHKAHAKMLAAGVHPAIAAAATGVGKKHRRMNWANHRALSRAERRIKAAVTHMTRYIRWVHPKKGGHAAPKFGKKH